jgi:protein SCO1
MRIRRFLWVLVGLATILGIAQYLLWGALRQKDAANPSYKLTISKPIKMTSHKGQPFTEKDIVGKPTLIFFGFLSCPDVCPTTLNDISGWLEALGSDADRLNTVYVSVDPARDTPQLMADYLSSFDHRIVGVTGSESELQKLTKALGVFYSKEATSENDYTMNHTASVLLLDTNGSLARTIDYHEKRSIAVKKIRLSLR